MSSTNPGSSRSEDRGRRQRPARLEHLQPGRFPPGSASRPQTGQGRGVDRVEDPPRGRIQATSPNRAGLLLQHRQIRDGLAAVGK